MTPRRATLYLAVAALAGVWLSSAAWSSMPQEPGSSDAHPVVVEEVQPPVLDRSRHLRERIASAPRPSESPRNPFAFDNAARGPASRAATESWRAVGADDHALAATAEPPFSLIGIAAHMRPEGPVRTAVIATFSGELIMASVGDVLLSRYTVLAVGAARVDVSDGETGERHQLELEGQ